MRALFSMLIYLPIGIMDAVQKLYFVTNLKDDFTPHTNEELIAIVSLVSLESKEIQGSGNSQIFLYQSQKIEKNYTTSFLLIFSGILGSILVIQSEKRRQQNMPLIRPLIMRKNSDGDYDYFIEITTRRALVKEIIIDGNVNCLHLRGLIL